MTRPSAALPFSHVDDRVFPILPIVPQPTGAKPKVNIEIPTDPSTESILLRTTTPAILTSSRESIRTPVSSAITSTVSTVMTRTTPSEFTSSGGSAQASATPSRSPIRRRTSSEGRSGGFQVGGTETEREELERIKTLVAVRSQSLAQDVSELLSRASTANGASVRWLEQEVKEVKDRIESLEELESTAWSKVGRTEGSTARTLRMTRWKNWKARQADKVRRAKSLSWEICQREVREDRAGSSTSCNRSAGHVEKVKLPTFTGKQEDFAEFKSQFRELCRGERYTPILEMAQLRQKLPKEALAAISGLQCPELAWVRMEEVYGNREMSILSALKTLRDFRATKSAAHEQVIELAMAVQKCVTELSNVDAVVELVSDRESIACLLLALPPTFRDKWYDQKVPEEARKRGEYLLKWLEEQRQNAIRIRLDTMAARLRTPAPAAPAKPHQSAGESTDKGLAAGAHLALGDAGSQGAKPNPPARDQQRIDDSTTPGRVEVKTSQDARQVADKRKASLEARKLDKCPICDQVHTYERTWAKLQPPVKARLVSTHLTTCSRFLALSPDEKMAAVLGNAGCIQCAAWDHSVHKFPGGKPTREPKCNVVVNGSACGGAHGKWYHGESAAGASHSVVVTAEKQGPGLYEVYLAPVHPAGAEAGSVSKAGMVMVDPGSDTNFVRHDFAAALGLRRETCQFK